MKLILSAALVAAVLSVALATTAEARPITLREALRMGFELKATTFIPQDQINHVMGATDWQDDILLTLQRGEQLAFCHMLASSTTRIETDADSIQCSFVVDFPIEDPPPVATTPSSEPPPAGGASSAQ